VNVKRAKRGGIGPAKALLARAHALGMRTYLGCMAEPSIDIAASAADSSLADWVDLDGNLLLAADPFVGLDLGSDKRWRLTERPGHGVTRKGS
jgi:L-alanine-DL-glutamate epimerase-like enolase superfamily enzyme